MIIHHYRVFPVHTLGRHGIGDLYTGNQMTSYGYYGVAIVVIVNTNVREFATREAMARRGLVQ